jgi:hypothetical protein
MPWRYFREFMVQYRRFKTSKSRTFVNVRERSRVLKRLERTRTF